MTGKKDPLSFMIMEFGLSDICWEDGKLLFNWWSNARGTKKYPSRKEFNPAEFKAQLPTIIIFDVVEGEGSVEIFFRLSGTKIIKDMRVNPQSMNLKEIDGGHHIYKRALALIESGKPYLVKDVPLSWSKSDYKFYNGLMLPLSSNGKDIDKILVSINIQPISL